MNPRHLYYLLLFVLCAGAAHQGFSQRRHQVPKPLFADPVHDGAADPVVVWNRKAKLWYMLYTNRRANITDTGGVKWVHGTRIGIATSPDGVRWRYLDTANIDYRPVAEYTHWAPEVIEHEGRWHMYLTYVPGIFTDWRHPRDIVHLTSTDLVHWTYQSTLALASDRVIDACVAPMPDGSWRMWYNNERDKKSIYYADSKDLYHWQQGGKALGDRGGEGPKVFRWKGRYWMVVDNWAGLGIYQSADAVQWTRQEDNILARPGKGTDDGAIGGHADVVVQGDKAFIYYFTHPGRNGKHPPHAAAARRSVIQMAELALQDGQLVCDRDQELRVRLKP